MAKNERRKCEDTSVMNETNTVSLCPSCHPWTAPVQRADTQSPQVCQKHQNVRKVFPLSVGATWCTECMDSQRTRSPLLQLYCKTWQITPQPPHPHTPKNTHTKLNKAQPSWAPTWTISSFHSRLSSSCSCPPSSSAAWFSRHCCSPSLRLSGRAGQRNRAGRLNQAS